LTLADFDEQLKTHRRHVAEAFHDAFRIAGVSTPAPQPAEAPVPEGDGDVMSDFIRERMGDEAEAVCRRMDAMLASSRMRSLPNVSRKRLDQLLPALLAAAAQTENPA